MRTSAGQRIRWFALATALAGMVIALTPVAASAGLHSPIPADAFGDPNDVFTDDQPLFAYALSDIRGGEICIVSATVQDASGLSCGGLNWGGKNSVVGIGTQFLPVASPPLRIGTWKLMTTDSEGNNAELSDVFSVIPCETSCSSALANDILQGYKQAAHTNLIGAATACLTFAAMELKGAIAKARGRAEGLTSAAKDFTTGAGYTAVLAGGTGFGLTFLAIPDFSNPGEEKAKQILKDLTCSLTSMYSDIWADPPDAGFSAVAQPTFSTIPALTTSTESALSQSIDRQRGLGVAVLHALERYQGAQLAGEMGFVHAQTLAIDDFGFQQLDEVRQTIALLRSYADEASADPDFNTPVVATEQDRDDLVALYARVRDSGFTADELTQLHALGYTDLQIGLIRTHFALDPSVLTVGATPLDLLRSFADTLEEGLPALDLFYRDASAVAGHTNQPPQAAFTDTDLGGNAHRFDSTATSDDLDPITVSWDFGDGGQGQGTSVQHTYASDGSYVVTQSACDYLVCATATKNVVIGSGGGGGGNHDPAPANDHAETSVGEAVTIDVLSNDSDPDGDPLSVVAFTQGTGGAVTCSALDCTYTAPSNLVGTDVFSYTVSDGKGGTASAQVSVDISGGPPANHRPDAVDDTVPIRLDAETIVYPTANDSDADFDTLTIESVTQPAHGSLDCQPGACFYTPEADFHGLDPFTYTIADGNGGTDTATVTMRVAMDVDPALMGAVVPIQPATDVEVDVPAEALIDVRNYGTTAAHDVTLTLTVPTDVSIVAAEAQDGTCTGSGPVVCTFPTVDLDRSYTATIRLTPERVGDFSIHAAVASPDPDQSDAGNEQDLFFTARSFALNVHKFTTVRATDYVSAGVGNIRGNDTGSIQISGVSGTVTEALLYWQGPTSSTDPNVNAEVTFAGTKVTGTNIGFSDDNCWGYDNSHGYRADVTSLVTGNGIYDLAGFTKYDMRADTDGVSLLVFFQDGDRTNDRDIVLFDGNDSNIVNFFDADGWNVELDGIDYNGGHASVEMHVADGQSAGDDALLIDGTVVAPAGGVFDGATVGPNASDNLWDIRPFDVTSLLHTGTNDLTITTSGSGSDCLSLVVAAINLPDGAAPPDQGPPVLTDDALETDQDVPVTIDVLANDHDPDGDQLAVVASTDGAHGSVTCVPDGACMYTPASGFSGSDVFTYTASDGHGHDAVANVAVTVDAAPPPVNRPPTVQGDQLTTMQDQNGSVNVLGNDSDPDGDLLAVVADTDGAHGSVDCAPDGACSYAPAAGFSGSDTFTYTVSDGQGHDVVGHVAVTVDAAPPPNDDPPVPQDDHLVTTQDVAGSVNVLANDSDPEGGALAVIAASDGAHGTVTCSASGVCTYTPNGGFTGSDAFTYGVSDLGGNQVIATVLVTVQPVVVTDALSLSVFSGSVSRPHLVYGVAGPLGAGDFDVSPSSGKPFVISGSGSLPSKSGVGTATVTFSLRYSAGSKKWMGSVTIVDPGARFSTTLSVRAGISAVSRRGSSVRGALSVTGSSPLRLKCSSITFRIDDLG